MTERDLYEPLIQGAKSEGWLLFRIQDDAPGLKPFDITGVSKTGRAVGLEVKVVDYFYQVYDRLAKHQQIYLEGYEIRNGLGLIGVYVASTKEMVVARYSHGSPFDELLYRTKLERVKIGGAEVFAKGWHNLE